MMIIHDKKRILLSVPNREILETAKRIKYIVEQLFDKPVDISRTHFGDIQLVLGDKEAVIEKEAFTFIKIIASKKELLSATTYAVLREYLGELPKGKTVVNYQQEQRILMIDIARKYFPKEMLYQFIDSMSLAQFNYLQLHFSENEGFRIESEVAPEIVSDKHLTKAEIREVIHYANKAGIEIIPDLDTPGHLKQILCMHPEWQLKKRTLDGKEKNALGALDICNPDAVAFILELYKEYADLFEASTYFHIGGDEFVDFDEIDAYPKLSEHAKENYDPKASGIDVFVAYVNQIIESMNHWGFIPRVWNDGFFRSNTGENVSLFKNVEITYWTKWNQHMAPVSAFADKGYRIINYNDNYFYYVLGENAGYSYPTYENIINNWTFEMYAQEQIVSGTKEQFPGVAVAVWCDLPDRQTELEIWENVSSLLFAVMQKLTGSVFVKNKGQVHTILRIFSEHS